MEMACRLPRVIPAVLLCLAGLILQGCSPKLDCNGDKVRADVLTIIKDKLDALGWYQRAKLGLSGAPAIQNVTTSARNDAHNTAACSAQYTFTHNKTPRKIAFDYSLSSLEDKKEVQVVANADIVEAELLQLFILQPLQKMGTKRFMIPQQVSWFSRLNGKIISCTAIKKRGRRTARP
jgi:hypothetical protein